MEYTRWNRIYAEVISGEMDLGVVAYPEKQRSIDVTPLAQEELVFVCNTCKITCSPGTGVAETAFLLKDRVGINDIRAFEKSGDER